MKKTRKNRWLGTLLVGALGATILGTACKGGTSFDFDFNDNLEAQLNQVYDPQIKADGGTKIVSVKLYNEDGEEIELASGYAFTPDELGNYYYVIVVETNGAQVEHRKTVVVKDTIAPTIVNAPTEAKVIELGVYAGFAEDLAAIEVDDNNEVAVAYITKKVVEITVDGKTETNADGFNEYVFKKAGEATVKVEIKDVTGNAAYFNYVLDVRDTTAPVINVLPLNYAWLDNDGYVTVPDAGAQDLSGATINVSAKKGTSSVAIVGGKIKANVGDVFTLTYSATDAYLNSENKVVKLKVLQRGALIDSSDANVDTLFSTGTGVLESGTSLSFVDSSSADTIEWLDGAYAFGSVKEFSGIELNVTNYQNSDVIFLLAAKVNGEKQYVGSATVPAKAATLRATSFVIDLTKAGLDEIDGWVIEMKSADVIHVDLNAIQMTSFADPYVTVSLASNYTKGSTFAYQVTQNGTEIYDGKVVLTGADVNEELELNEEYTFKKAGSYTAVFAFDIGNKIYTVTKTFNVVNSGVVVEVGEIVGGKVGKVYTLPTETASTTVTKEVVAPSGSNLTITDGKITPTEEGRYVINYKSGSTTVASYSFYVEGVNQVAFESVEAFNFEKVINGGFVKDSDGTYATAGKTAAKASVEARDSIGVLWSNSIQLTGKVNYVTMDVYANLAGGFKVALIIGDEMETYAGREVTLNAGSNEVTFVIGSTLGKKFNNAEIKGILVYNQSQYNNIYYIDNIKFSEKDSTSEAEVFNVEKDTIYAQVGGIVVIPNVISCDSKLIKSQVATIKKGSQTLFTAIPGSPVSLEGVAAGQYKIVYTVETDGYSSTYTKNVTLVIGEQMLVGELQLADYFVGKAVELPEPILASDYYSSSALSKAVVNKYYRATGGLDWVDANAPFLFDSTGYVDVKYTVTVGETKVSLYEQIYIHQEGVHLDFEAWSGGAHMGYVKSYSQKALVSMYDGWSIDGKYSAKIGANTAYNDCAGIIYREKEEEPIQIGFAANAVVVWIYSEAERMENYFSIDNYDWKYVDGALKIKKGVHKYVIPLYDHSTGRPATVSSYKRILFEMWKNESFYIDNWSFVQIGDVEFPNVDGMQYNVLDGILLDKPVASNLNKLAFTDGEIANAIAQVRVTKDGETNVYTYGAGALQLPLEKGNYTLEFVYTVGTYEFKSTQKITVRNFDIEFIEPRILYETGVGYEIELPVTPLEGVAIKAYVSAKGANDWTQLQTSNGKAQIKLVGEGFYEIKFVATYGEFTEEMIYGAVIRATNTVADFEINEDGTHVINQGSIDERQGWISDEWAYDGKYSYYIKATGDDFTKVTFTEQYNKSNPERYLQLDKSYNTITMWINATRAMTGFYIEVHGYNASGKARWISSSKVNVAIGVNQYVFTFTESFDNIFSIGWKAHYQNYTNFYVDTIRLYNVSVELPTVPQNSVAIGDEVVFGTPTVTAEGLTTSVTVKAKSKGGSYETVELVDGKYTAAFASGGEAEIVIEIMIGESVVRYTYTIMVLDESFDQGAGDIPWDEV